VLSSRRSSAETLSNPSACVEISKVVLQLFRCVLGCAARLYTPLACDIRYYHSTRRTSREILGGRAHTGTTLLSAGLDAGFRFAIKTQDSKPCAETINLDLVEHTSSIKMSAPSPCTNACNALPFLQCLVPTRRDLTLEVSYVRTSMRRTFHFQHLVHHIHKKHFGCALQSMNSSSIPINTQITRSKIS
jgi:hypothetical protein